VQNIANDVVQDICIKHRWETLDEDNKAYKQAKNKEQSITATTGLMK